jgi:hypothetical protein
MSQAWTECSEARTLLPCMIHSLPTLSVRQLVAEISYALPAGTLCKYRSRCSEITPLLQHSYIYGDHLAWPLVVGAALLYAHLISCFIVEVATKAYLSTCAYLANAYMCNKCLHDVLQFSLTIPCISALRKPHLLKTSYSKLAPHCNTMARRRRSKFCWYQ